jgi:hypothetical protein
MRPFSLGPLLVTWPLALILAACLGILAPPWRKLRPFTGTCFAISLTFLLLTAGNPLWQLATPGQIAVMIDVSPSTRGASFRDSALLKRRLDQLLGDKPFSLIKFANRNIPTPELDTTEIPSDQTTFTPPPAHAIVLFSDGRFSLHDQSPPVYPVIDPLLQNPTDASITDIQTIGNQVAVTVTNNGPPRTLTLDGVSGPTTQLVEGNQTIIRQIDPTAAQITAFLSPADLWPENDSMSIRVPQRQLSERWWIGPSVPTGWTNLSPSQLPADPAGYLAPSVIVLNNLPADQLSPSTQAHLNQFVRDLGGSLVILGGDTAFASGGYEGTTIGELSPLASSPPVPSMQWILLIDASGSMSQSVDEPGQTRWSSATRALVNLLPGLPPADTISVGQFSDTLTWWSDGKTARQTALLDLPPPSAQPHGPTNLQPVLKAIASNVNPLPTQLILITDADVAFDEPAALAARLKKAGVHLNLLAIERGSGLAQLQTIVNITGGTLMPQNIPQQWATALRQLLIAALPQRLRHDATGVSFIGAASAIPGGTTAPWNVTWPKDHVTPIAIGKGSQFVAATWHVGLGQVLATAFSPTDAQTQSLVQLVASQPHDPRIQVSWRTGPSPRVTINAQDHGTYLNNLDLTLRLEAPHGQTPQTYLIPQTGPGTYELSLPPQPEAAIATVLHDNAIIDRMALPGWYCQEFSRLGNDIPALEELARRSGGSMILPSQTTPIQFNWPRRDYRLTPWLAMAAAMSLGVGLVAWRAGR